MNSGGAGQTIIEDRYKRMAARRKRIRLFNTLSLVATVLYLSSRPGQASAAAKAGTQEMLSAAAEALIWLCFMAGLGWGKAHRESAPLLKTAAALGIGALTSHLLVLNPARIRRIGKAAWYTWEHPGAKTLYQAIAGLAEPAAMGFRLGTISSCFAYLKDKASRQRARTKAT